MPNNRFNNVEMLKDNLDNFGFIRWSIEEDEDQLPELDILLDGQDVINHINHREQKRDEWESWIHSLTGNAVN